MPDFNPSTMGDLVMITLIGVLGWIGAQVHIKIDQLSIKVESKLDELNRTLRAIESDLRGELTNLDRRVTRVETRCDDCYTHGGEQ